MLHTYIFMSRGDDGYTENNAAQPSNNVQVLAIAQAETIEEAIADFEENIMPFDPVEVDYDAYAGDSEDGYERPWEGYTVAEMFGESTWKHVLPPGKENRYRCGYCAISFTVPHHCIEHGQEECPVCHSIDIKLISKEKE